MLHNFINRLQYILTLVYLITFFLTTKVSYGQASILPAFPGAEGHGKYVTGGRGGQVIYVANLNDDNNPGSLRYAINQAGPRIILFKVSGTIQLKTKLSITKGDVTIAGQTAPGDGITLRDYPVEVSADNVIIRFIRFRMGDESNQEADALGGRYFKNIMVDHCSASWSVDECVSFYQNENFTLQWCILSESLRNSVHDKGAHGYGGIWGGKNASFHHNLLAHHDSRNPRLGETGGDSFALTDLVDLRNNVIYNWVGNSAYGAEAMNVNMVNNYYKPGPGTTKTERIISIDKLTDPGSVISNKWGKFFIDGNFMSASARATSDNWSYGVYNQYHSKYGTVPEADKISMRLITPLNMGEITTHSAEKGYEKVLDFAGTSLKRDTVDKRIITDVRTGTATFMSGGNGSANGIIDSQSAVGGWPDLKSLPAPPDTDKDGMADAWEEANGLLKNNPSDAQLTTLDGKYPNLEVYINSLVSSITENQIKESLTTSITTIKTEGVVHLNVDSSAGILKIIHPFNTEFINVYSISGTLMKTQISSGSPEEIEINDLNPGIYIVSLHNKDQVTYSKKFIKK
jgi:pectate lyase